jgi:hypothetical protein
MQQQLCDRPDKGALWTAGIEGNIFRIEAMKRRPAQNSDRITKDSAELTPTERLP